MKYKVKRYLDVALIVLFLLLHQLIYADVFNVTNDSPDDVPGSFMRAMINANTSTNNLPHTIKFTQPMVIDNINNSFGFIHATIIDGTSVPGYQGAPLVKFVNGNAMTVISFSSAYGATSFEIKGVEIDGNKTAIGLEVPAHDVLIKNNVINNCANGITIAPSSTNITIVGNYIGTDQTGMIAKPNGVGIQIFGFGGFDRNIVIGGTSEAERNIISGNTNRGINLDGVQAVCLSRSGGVKIIGNYIGTNVLGKNALGNGYGIFASGFSNFTIGAEGDLGRNIISGNKNDGIQITSSSTNSSDGIIISNNYIGTDVTGLVSLPNNIGINLGLCASSITIGGASSSLRNVISGNLNEGIKMAGEGYYGNQTVKDVKVIGNYIGTDKTGSNALHNNRGILLGGATDEIVIGGTSTEERNIISGNTKEGIYIADITLNKTIEQNNNITISNNIIGLIYSGNKKLSNYWGLVIEDGAKNILIGGDKGQGNIISGNTNSGIEIRGQSNKASSPSKIKIYSNLIGVDLQGKNSIANQDGIHIWSTDTVSIGRMGMGNIISGNVRNGVWVEDHLNKGVFISSNKIGLSSTDEILPSNGCGILITKELLFMEEATISSLTSTNADPAVAYKIGGHLSTDGGNIISGHHTGGILVEYIDDLLFIENNTVQNNVVNKIGNEVMLIDCSLFTIGGEYPNSPNTIKGFVLLNKCTDGLVRRNNIGNSVASLFLGNGTERVVMAENNLSNTIYVTGNTTYNNRITQNSITSTTKPINLEYDGITNLSLSNAGNEGIKVPEIISVVRETGVISGKWSDYSRFNSGTIIKKPLVEIFSTDEKGMNALEFLGCAEVDENGNWTTKVNFKDNHRFVFANVTGPQVQVVTVFLQITPLSGNGLATASSSPCSLDLTPLNTSEFSKVYPIGCGEIAINTLGGGCAAFTPTSFYVSFDNFAGSTPSNYTVVIDFGDGTPVYKQDYHSASSYVIADHQYQHSGSYTVTMDLLVPDIANKTLVRHPCLSAPEKLTVTVDNCKPCDGCLPSFSPDPGKKFIFSAWIKQNVSSVSSYKDIQLFLDFVNQGTTVSSAPFIPKGDIIDGWQRVEDVIEIPQGTEIIKIRIKNGSSNHSLFVDDVRLHPFNAKMKSYVYDPLNLRLMAELDENNYATFYEYDEEGQLIRVKKETERGVMTIRESRTNTSKVK